MAGRLNAAALPAWLRAPYAQFADGLSADRVPHALIVQCPDGWAVERLAAAMTCDLLEIETRLDVREFAHPDFVWLAPEEGSLQYKVAQLRAAIDFMQRTAQAGGRKVLVLSAAERLSVESANTLLKTLEEPPPGSHWLLLSESPGQLLATIRSRCQRLDATPGLDADGGELIDELLDGERADASQREMLAFEYAGAPEPVAAAILAGDGPLWPHLERLLAGRASATETAETLQAWGSAELLNAWQRYQHAALAGKLPSYVTPRPPAAHPGIDRSAQELLRHRRLLARHAGVNVRLVLERLARQWAKTWAQACA
ncbi:MAG: hypothetical protein AAF515_11150 [Pseudomonadota bacterium]